MVTRPILGRIVVIGVLIASLSVIGHAALLWTSGKPAKRDGGATADLTSFDKSDTTPVRVVYPGPDAPSPKVTGQLPSTPFPDPTAKGPDPQPPQPQPVAPPTDAHALGPARSLAAVAAPKPTETKVADLDPMAAEALGTDGATEAAAAPPTKPLAGTLDINTASPEALDRLGGGRIGQTIAHHRPYASLEDLVRKRVLRRSVFEQIKGHLATR